MAGRHGHGRRPRGGRYTPKGTVSRSQLLVPGADEQRRRGPDENPFDILVAESGTAMLEEADPLAAECWASRILSTFAEVGFAKRLEGAEVPDLNLALLERCLAVPTPASFTVATSLAAVLPGAVRLDIDRGQASRAARATAEAIQRTGVIGPAWLGQVGQTRLGRAWLASDVFGDQDSLIISLQVTGGASGSALCALIDHNLGGQAKDAFVAESMDEAITAWRESTDPHVLLKEVPLEIGIGKLRDGFAQSAFWNGENHLRTEEFAEHEAFAWALLSREGVTDTDPNAPEVDEAVMEALVAEFLDSTRAQELKGMACDVELVARYLFDLRARYEGRPYRFSPTVVTMLMVDLAPRKLVLDAPEIQGLPDVLRAIVSFAAERTGLARSFVSETVEAIDRAVPDYEAAMLDPASAGPAKAVLTVLRDKGVDLAEEAAVEGAIAEINASGGLGRRPSDVNFSGPRRRAKVKAHRASAPIGDVPEEVVVEVGDVEILKRFDALTSFYGEGRKLTQKGNPTLADAKELVQLLPTNDVIDEVAYGRIHKTRSSQDLTELSYTIGWAVKAGVIRKVHNKFAATTKWENLAMPARFATAADALMEIGPLAERFVASRWGFHGAAQVFDETVPMLLDRLVLERQVPFEDLLDDVCDYIDDFYEWQGGYMTEPENRRRSFRLDLNYACDYLALGGIAAREGATEEPDPVFTMIEQTWRVGGTVTMSKAGTWWWTERHLR